MPCPGCARSCLPAVQTSRKARVAPVLMNDQVRQVFRGETLFIGDRITEMTPKLADRPTEPFVPLAYVLLTRSKLSYLIGDYACKQLLKTNIQKLELSIPLANPREFFRIFHEFSLYAVFFFFFIKLLLLNCFSL